MTQLGDRAAPAQGARGLVEMWARRPHFRETHRIRVSASRERVFRALRAVTPDEIPFFNLLLAVKNRGRAPRRRVRRSMLSALRAAGFVVLAERPGRELVLGAIGRFWDLQGPLRGLTQARFAAFARPDHVKVTTSFHLERRAAGACQLETQTRIIATDSRARLKFALYWACIRPGSGFVRRMWLLAVRRRAEATAPTPGPARARRRPRASLV